MRRRLSAAAVAEAHVGQVVTAGPITQARIAREQAGGFGHFFNVIEHWYAGTLHGGEPLGLAGQCTHHAVQQRRAGAAGERRQTAITGAASAMKGTTWIIMIMS